MFDRAALKAAFVGFGVDRDVGGCKQLIYVLFRRIGGCENFFPVALRAHAYFMSARGKSVEVVRSISAGNVRRIRPDAVTVRAVDRSPDERAALEIEIGRRGQNGDFELRCR